VPPAVRMHSRASQVDQVTQMTEDADPQVERLTENERADLISHIDVDALERLLHHFASDERDQMSFRVARSRALDSD
jgi:hypothetical protein